MSINQDATEKKFDHGEHISTPQEIDFWRSPDSLEYVGVSEDLPSSNIPAYAVAYHLLAPRGKNILDFGCFQGDCTARILNLGADHVMGVDNNPNIIEQARTRYSGHQNMSFSVVGDSLEIPLMDNEGKYDCAAMTFVHPTIGSKEELQKALSLIGRSIKPSGKIVMLGLHPNSFNPQYHFRQYGHKLPKSGRYEDGVAFPNELIMNDGSSLRFNDYCWTERTIGETLNIAGFSNVKTINLTQDLSGTAGDVLRGSIDQLRTERNVDFSTSPEFQAPLYQIFVAEKVA